MSQQNLAILAHDPESGRVINVKAIFDMQDEYGSTREMSASIGKLLDWLAIHTDFDSFGFVPAEYKHTVSTAMYLRDLFSKMTELEPVKHK